MMYEDIDHFCSDDAVSARQTAQGSLWGALYMAEVDQRRPLKPDSFPT